MEQKVFAEPDFDGACKNEHRSYAATPDTYDVDNFETPEATRSGTEDGGAKVRAIQVVDRLPPPPRPTEQKPVDPRTARIATVLAYLPLTRAPPGIV